MKLITNNNVIKIAGLALITLLATGCEKEPNSIFACGTDWVVKDLTVKYMKKLFSGRESGYVFSNSGEKTHIDNASDDLIYEYFDNHMSFAATYESGLIDKSYVQCEGHFQGKNDSPFASMGQMPVKYNVSMPSEGSGKTNEATITYPDPARFEKSRNTKNPPKPTPVSRASEYIAANSGICASPEYVDQWEQFVLTSNSKGLLAMSRNNRCFILPSGKTMTIPSAYTEQSTPNGFPVIKFSTPTGSHAYTLLANVRG